MRIVRRRRPPPPFPFRRSMPSSIEVVVRRRRPRPTDGLPPGVGGGGGLWQAASSVGRPEYSAGGSRPQRASRVFPLFYIPKEEKYQSSSSSSVRGGGGWQKPRYLRLRVARVPVACGVAGRTLFDNTSDRSDAPARHVLCTILNNGQNGVRV